MSYYPPVIGPFKTALFGKVMELPIREAPNFGVVTGVYHVFKIVDDAHTNTTFYVYALDRDAMLAYVAAMNKIKESEKAKDKLVKSKGVEDTTTFRLRSDPRMN